MVVRSGLQLSEPTRFDRETDGVDDSEGNPHMEAPAPDLGRPEPASSDIPDNLVKDMDRDDLSRLIREANDGDTRRPGLSFQQMADRAIDPETGETLSKPYFQKLAAGVVGATPTASRLRAIAAAISRPLTVVQRAAARQYLDYQATELSGYDDDTRIIVAHLSGMNPRERKRWRRMVEAAEEVQDD